MRKEGIAETAVWLPVLSYCIASPKSGSVLFEKHPLCGSVSRFQPAHICTAFPRQQDRKQLLCVARIRFGAEAERGSSLVSTQVTRTEKCHGRQTWKIEGDYLYTMMLTDIATGWTACLSLLHRICEAVLAAIKRASHSPSARSLSVESCCMQHTSASCPPWWRSERCPCSSSSSCCSHASSAWTCERCPSASASPT